MLFVGLRLGRGALRQEAFGLRTTMRMTMRVAESCRQGFGELRMGEFLVDGVGGTEGSRMRKGVRRRWGA